MLANFFSALGILTEILNVFLMAHTGHWCEPLLLASPLPWILAYGFSSHRASQATEAAHLVARIHRRG